MPAEFLLWTPIDFCFLQKNQTMKLPIYVLAAALTLLSTGCLMRRTVTKNGEVIESNYVVKRPLKH